MNPARTRSRNTICCMILRCHGATCASIHIFSLLLFSFLCFSLFFLFLFFSFFSLFFFLLFFSFFFLFLFSLFFFLFSFLFLFSLPFFSSFFLFFFSFFFSVSVCGSTFHDGRTRAHATSTALASVQSSSQRVGALSPIPSCLGIGRHPSGSRQGHPRYTGARSAGRPWVARTTVQHMVKRVCCAMADPETKKSMGRSTRTSKRRSATRSPVRELICSPPGFAVLNQSQIARLRVCSPGTSSRLLTLPHSCTCHLVKHRRTDLCCVRLHVSQESRLFATPRTLEFWLSVRLNVNLHDVPQPVVNLNRISRSFVNLNS